MKPRHNPFASHRLENLAFRLPAGVTWDAFLARCAGARWRGAIVGPHGSGKTTLLEELVPRLRALGFGPRLVTINAETKIAEKETLLAQIRTWRAPDLLLLDGAEQLTTRQWLMLHSAASPLAGCLITVHYTSRLPTLLETQTSPALLTELATELTGELLLDTNAAALFKRHRGNLRECLRELYDLHAVAPAVP